MKSKQNCFIIFIIQGLKNENILNGLPQDHATIRTVQANSGFSQQALQHRGTVKSHPQNCHPINIKSLPNHNGDIS